MRIILNRNATEQEIKDIKKSISDNNGYCPCKIRKTEDTKCMCKEFKEQESGVCHCGLYEKV